MSNPRKCLRVSEIKRSNAMVEKVINTISDDFINPFEKDLDQGNLFSLISGVSVNEDIAVSLLSIKEIGKEAMGDFINRLILNEGTKSFSDKIKKSQLKTFQDSFVKAKVSKNGKQQEIQVQTNILAKLVHFSSFTKSAINLEKAMCFPLAPVSGKTVKSKLFDAAMHDLTVIKPEDLPSAEELSVYFLDLAAEIRIQVKL